jgi:TonB-dependent SusC/RagA subfamily outer membrane receptor
MIKRSLAAVLGMMLVSGGCAGDLLPAPASTPAASVAASPKSIRVPMDTFVHAMVGTTNALVVMDGRRIPADYGGVEIDVNEIRGIRMLRDRAAARLYGAAGANGVLIVTTRHARARS